MALTYPIDLLAEFPGWTTGFDLLWRQEHSRTANGRTIVKDLGDPLWTLKAQSKPLSPNELSQWRARLNVLENGLGTFRGYESARQYPIAYPRGTWPAKVGFTGSNAKLHTIGSNNKSIRLEDLPPGYVLSVGDHISIAGNLHQVSESAAANSSGLTPAFEVRPHLWPVSAVGQLVSVRKPHCIMSIMPGTVSSDSALNGRGVISFQAIEMRN